LTFIDLGDGQDRLHLFGAQANQANYNGGNDYDAIVYDGGISSFATLTTARLGKRRLVARKTWCVSSNVERQFSLTKVYPALKHF
jgi:hypothetical protein